MCRITTTITTTMMTMRMRMMVMMKCMMVNSNTWLTISDTTRDTGKRHSTVDVPLPCGLVDSTVIMHPFFLVFSIFFFCLDFPFLDFFGFSLHNQDKQHAML